MFEVILILGIIFWGIKKLSVWVFNALLGVLPEKTADTIRRWVRFAIGALVVLVVLSAMAST